MLPIRKGMWVNTEWGVGILVDFNLQTDEGEVHLVAEDGTTREVRRGVDLHVIGQAGFDQIPASRRPHPSSPWALVYAQPESARAFKNRLKLMSALLPKPTWVDRMLHRFVRGGQ